MAYKRISPQPVVEGGTGIQSATAYAPLCGNGTSGFQSASTGQSNSGYVLTSTGSSSLPTWQSSGGSGGGYLVLIQSQTITFGSSNVAFTSGISSTYNDYIFFLSYVTPVNAGDNILFQFSTNGGSTWLTSGYTAGCNYTTSYTSSSQSNINSTSHFILAPNLYNIVQYGVNGTLYCFNITNGNTPTINGLFTYSNNTGPGYGSYSFAGGSNTTANINAFNFNGSSGGILGGTISLYGLLE